MSRHKSIVLGGGCFWCLEAAFQNLTGVETVTPGYSGGHVENPTYEQVVSGATGHAEVVRVLYDPEIISLTTVLAVFWIIHDPTSHNAQGADVGSQYASVIYYENNTEYRDIKSSLNEAQSHLHDRIVTHVELLDSFYEAEDYHHNYFLKNPGAGYCRAVIEPKLSKLRQHFSPLLKA